MTRFAMLLACVLVGFAFRSGSAGAEHPGGFAVNYARAAQVVCHFRDGPLVRFVDYGALDRQASYIGMRNFFVALRIYGRAYACADALSTYGPRGAIRRGLLME